jgi:uncharacterized protein (TIGR03437 family)
MISFGQIISRQASSGSRHPSLLAILAFATALAGPVLAQPGPGQIAPLFYRADYLLDNGVDAGASGVVIADLNNDGKLDYAIGAGYGIDVALGNGDGTFQPFKSFIPAGGGISLDSELSSAAADFDGDGNIDLIMFLGNGVTLLPGHGDGTFGPGRLITSLPVVCSCLSNGVLQTADLNHDGHPDLVFVTFSGASPGVPSVVVLLNDGNGAFTSSTAFNLSGNGYAVGLAVADLNHDGVLDLAVITQVFATFGPPPAIAGYLYVGLGKGNGAFSSPALVAALNQVPSFIAAADFNHDGSPDLAVESGTTFIFLGNGDGSFRGAPNVNLGGTNPGSMAIADWTGNGNLGIGIFTQVTPQGIGIVAGNGDGTFYAAGTAAMAHSTASVDQVLSADLNGDGLPDLVVLGIAAGNFPTASVFLNAGPSPPLGFVSTSAASGITAVAPTSISSMYDQFPFIAAQLPSVTVTIQDSAGVSRPAPLFYASPTQINLEIPSGTAPGVAAVMVASSGPPIFGTALVRNVVPAIFTEPPGAFPAAYAVTYGSDNQPQPPVLVSTCQSNGCTSVPIPRPAGTRVFLELYGTGIRNQVSPAVVSTAGGPGFSQSGAAQYAGPQGQYEGLDQVNVEITSLPAMPSSSTPTIYALILNVDGQVSNAVLFQVE